MSLRSSKQPDVPSARILLVDDHRTGLSARCSVLRETGYLAIGVSSCREALETALSEKFDLIVTDYKMPEMTGIDFIALLRSNSLHMPVVLLSGYVDALGLSEENTGADAVIMKSANEVQHLLRAVKQLLASKSRRRPPRRVAAAAPIAKKKSAS